MDFALSDEQGALADAERAWLVKNDPIAARRPVMDESPARMRPEDRRHLAESALAELLTEDMGGTHIDLGVLVEEHGRACSPVPLPELALAARLFEEVDWSESIRAAVLAGVIVPVLGSSDPRSLVGDVDGDTLHLSGTSTPLCGPSDATHLLAVTTLEDGTDVAAAVSVDAARIRTLETLDLTRAWDTVEIDVRLGEGEWSPLPAGTAARVRDQLATYRAFDAVGAANRLVEMTVAYAKDRNQFGKPIASFQAIKHHCANMALAVESSRAAVWAAAVALDDPTSERTRAVSAAAAYVGDATSTVAQTALQVHGGIGFTWEHDLHLLLRRIKVDELVDGTVSYHRRRLATA